MKKAAVVLASACAVVPAAESAFAQAPASTGGATSAAPTPEPAQPQAAAAGERLISAYGRWHRRLGRHDVWRGRNLREVAGSQSRAPATDELRAAIHRMKRRFRRFLRSPRGRAVRFAAKVRTIPAWGRGHLRSIARCESRGNPRAIGGGGAFRGLYQFTFGTWRVVGGSGDPAVAPPSEQTWRAWLLLSRHGSHHWPVCG
jgi:Transglycosylase-like domain